MHLWHTLLLHDLYKTLNSGEKGLSSAEAERRLRQFGYNQISVKKESFWKKLLAPFKSIFITILLIAALISFLSGKNLDAIVILVIVAINTLIWLSQQQTTERVLNSLKKHYEQIVQVLRNGQVTKLNSKLLVLGDVVVLGEGQKIPADGRVIEAANLFIDESALTGESLPIKKNVSVLSADKKIFERDNMLFSGTYVVSGSAKALIVATGMQTEFGKIAKLAVKQEPKSPLQKKIDQIVSKLIKLLAILALVVFLLALLRGIAVSEALRFVLSFIVSAVPEDLPIALTIIFVLGMRRMAKHKALVRSVSAIENLGLITAIAIDKTGTLTKNHLAVASAWTAQPRYDIKQAAIKALGDANSLEPFDHALKQFAANMAANHAKPEKIYPFNQQQRASGVLWQEGSKHKLYLKGAPEHIIKLCRLGRAEAAKAEAKLRQMVANGFRVIAIAKADVSSTLDNLENLKKYELELLGLIAFADELRPESAPSIAAAQAAGISVKMITGDHFDTAFHIGRTLNISQHRDQVVEGDELPKSEDELETYVRNKNVFARILPAQKFALLAALKRSEITAMTGDGVNDVPALTKADIGIAMASSSDIAKDAGDIVLLDNNFASIVRAISEGRVIYDNIRKMLFYLLSTTLGEVLTIIGALLLGLPLPVTAIQILWVNLVTDTALVIPLGLEPAEADHMNRPPRQPKAPILDKTILTRIVIVGGAMAISILAYFTLLTHWGYSHEYAQTVAFAMLVVSQWVNAFNARSEGQSLLSRLRTPNYKLLVGLALAMLAQALVMFGPLQEAFDIQAVSSAHLLTGLAITSAAVYLAAEIHKQLHRKISI